MSYVQRIEKCVRSVGVRIGDGGYGAVFSRSIQYTIYGKHHHCIVRLESD